MNTTQDPPPAQNATAHSYNTSFPTTSLGFRIYIIIIIITLNRLEAYLFYQF